MEVSNTLEKSWKQTILLRMLHLLQWILVTQGLQQGLISPYGLHNVNLDKHICLLICTVYGSCGKSPNLSSRMTAKILIVFGGNWSSQVLGDTSMLCCRLWEASRVKQCNFSYVILWDGFINGRCQWFLRKTKPLLGLCCTLSARPALGENSNCSE